MIYLMVHLTVFCCEGNYAHTHIYIYRYNIYIYIYIDHKSTDQLTINPICPPQFVKPLPSPHPKKAQVNMVNCGKKRHLGDPGFLGGGFKSWNELRGLDPWGLNPLISSINSNHLVILNIFYFHPDPWGNDPNWLIFSAGLKAPTSFCSSPETSKVFLRAFFSEKTRERMRMTGMMSNTECGCFVFVFLRKAGWYLISRLGHCIFEI